MIDQDQRLAWAKVIADHLCESWGWMPDEPEAIQLGMNIAFNMEVLVAHTNTSAEALLQGLLPLGALSDVKITTAPLRKVLVVQEV